MQPSRPSVSFQAHIACVCGASVEAPVDAPPPATPQPIIRYQGRCVCGRVYFLSVAGTHGGLPETVRHA